jgi:hypothetical protein
MTRRPPDRAGPRMQRPRLASHHPRNHARWHHVARFAEATVVKHETTDFKKRTDARGGSDYAGTMMRASCPVARW